MSVSIREIEANGLRFSCRETGTGSEPVLLLHGFPETSRMWDSPVATLADAGFAESTQKAPTERCLRGHCSTDRICSTYTGVTQGGKCRVSVVWVRVA